VIENTRSKEIEHGLFIGVLNGRGPTSRGMTDGGVQGRELAARYQKYAEGVAFEWHRTAAILTQIAKNYEHFARRFDDDAVLMALGKRLARPLAPESFQDLLVIRLMADGYL
jgi:hypothetical protein